MKYKDRFTIFESLSVSETVALAYVQEQPKDFKISIRHELKHIYQYDCGVVNY